jgi:hypothetical protein
VYLTFWRDRGGVRGIRVRGVGGSPDFGTESYCLGNRSGSWSKRNGIAAVGSSCVRGLGDADKPAPYASAAFLKLVNELGASSGPQLMAKTMPAPQ